MNTYLDCIPCMLRQALEAARAHSDDVRVHQQLLRDALGLVIGLDLDRPPPVVGQAIHRRLRELTGSDPYLAAKRRFNRLALEALPELEALVRRAEDPLLAAARCAVAANAIDMGISAAISDEAARAALRGLSELEPVHGDWRALQAAAGAADRILYLADNAGEIAVDRLVVQALGPERVTVAVRGGPVLNDATLDDARDVGLLELVEVIDNGSDAPGTILEDCSPAFRRRFEQAQLVDRQGPGQLRDPPRRGGEGRLLVQGEVPGDRPPGRVAARGPRAARAG